MYIKKFFLKKKYVIVQIIDIVIVIVIVKKGSNHLSKGRKLEKMRKFKKDKYKICQKSY